MKLVVFAAISVLSAFSGLASETIDDLNAQAKNHYAQGQFDQAMKTLAEGGAGRAELAAPASSALTDLGIAEFDRRNFKNAYAAFRQALKLNPANQTATQYFLRIRRDMDVNNLKNEGAAPTGVQVAQAGTPSSPLPGASPAVTSGTADRVAAEAAEDLGIIKAQLTAAEARINETSTLSESARKDNAILRRQLEQQRALVDRLIANQGKPSGSDTAKLQETIDLLAMIAEQQADKPIVIQSDPALSALVKRLEMDAEESARIFSARNLPVMVSVSVVALFLVAVILVIILVARAQARARREQNPFRNIYSPNAPLIEGNAQGLTALPQGRPAGLLEFSGSAPAESRDSEINLRKSLIKADHLQRMYDDIKNGSLSWETVRNYVDELETTIRADILNVVEKKLDSGTLVSQEAVLPVLFPFLTDFDDFLREKAQTIAKQVLIESRTSKGTAEGDPLFSINAMLEIPKRLAEVMNQKDRSLVTAKISLGISRQLGLSRSECENVYKGALAHDAGYLMLDLNTLQSIIAKEEIEESEWAFIQSHVGKGLAYFGDASVPDYIKEAILHHHERNDGSGYPNGLKKDEIPKIAKIIGVAETFASLITSRSYRDKMEVGHALAIIKDGTRRKFDGPIVSALETVVKTEGGSW